MFISLYSQFYNRSPKSKAQHLKSNKNNQIQSSLLIHRENKFMFDSALFTFKANLQHNQMHSVKKTKHFSNEWANPWLKQRHIRVLLFICSMPRNPDLWMFVECLVECRQQVYSITLWANRLANTWKNTSLCKSNTEK